MGVDNYSNWPLSVQELPHVGGLEDANVERIVALKPDHQVSWEKMGTALRDLMRYDEALEAYQKAVELDPSWGSARLAYADMLVRQGPEQLQRAIAEYEAFLIVSQSEGEVRRVRSDLPRLKKKLAN